jgi:uncharacterized ubiquitin-like protein YukD
LFFVEISLDIALGVHYTSAKLITLVYPHLDISAVTKRREFLRVTEKVSIGLAVAGGIVLRSAFFNRPAT